MRKSLSGIQPNDPFFPKTRVLRQPAGGNVSIYLSSPVEEVKYDSFCQYLKKLCEADSVKATGVGQNHTSHSF